MKARALITGTLLAALVAGMPVARSEVFTDVRAGVAASARWSAGGMEAFVGVSNGEPQEQQLPSDLYAYLYWFDWRSGVEGRVPALPAPSPGRRGNHVRSMGCQTQVKLEAGQFTYDTTLERATLSIPNTECGPVRVNWVQTGPLSPGYGVSVSPPTSFFSVTGGGAGVSRPALATGWINKVRLTEDEFTRASLSFGAGAYAIFFGGSTAFSYLGAFRGIGATFQHGSTIVMMFAGQSTGADVSDSGVWQGMSSPSACVYVRSMVRTSGRNRPAFDGGCGPVQLEIDPLLQSATIKGRLGGVTVDVTFTGAGDLTPENQTEQDLPSGPDDVLEPFYVDGHVYASRVATIGGRVSSRRLRSSFAAQGREATIYQGLHGGLYKGDPYYSYLEE